MAPSLPRKLAPKTQKKNKRAITESLLSKLVLMN